MNDSREFNASTVEEALSKASEKLGIPEEGYSYEVVDSGSDGFLGIGARDARIIVYFEREDEEVTASSEPSDDVGSDAFAEETETFVPKNSSEREEEPPSPAYDSAESITSERDDLEVKEEVEAAPDELVEEVRNYVANVVDAMGLGARVDVYDTDEYIAVDIASDHTALIIGQKGETIDALQYLVNSAVYREREFVKRIVLDSEGYRQRRVEAIQGMAHRTARKSLREQRDIEMPPMNSSERRVVHVYLKENPDVNTFSEGSGNDRRVIVSPN